MKRSRCAIIACDVFKEELEAFSADGEAWGAFELLEMGLHDQPDVLRQEVQALVERLEEKPEIEFILLLYGICGNGLIGVRSSRCQLVLPRAHDCISVLLGGPDKHEAVLRENPGTYFYSPGWVRGRRVPGPDRDKYLQDLYGKKYPDDEELVEDLIEADHEAFSHHNCAAYVDVTSNTEAEAYCQKCATSLGWSYRRLAGDSSLIRDLLAGNWDPERFLVTSGGEAIESVLSSPSRGIQG